MINMFSQMLYIDPAATSVLLSSITAIVLALGASAIIIWRKLKKKVEKTFKIDPNSKKEVEEELVMTDQEIENASQQTIESVQTEKVEDIKE